MSISGKKFSWKNVSDFLTDKQLKNVMGGSDNGYGTCCVRPASGPCVCGVSSGFAIAHAGCQDLVNGTNCEGNWCCDSCGSASWVSEQCVS